MYHLLSYNSIDQIYDLLFSPIYLRRKLILELLLSFFLFYV